MSTASTSNTSIESIDRSPATIIIDKIQLSDLMNHKKSMNSMAALEFKRCYSQYDVFISDESISLQHQNAAKDTNAIDSIKIDEIQHFCRLFRTVLTNLHISIDENHCSRNNLPGLHLKAFESIQFPSMKAFSLEIKYKNQKIVRPYSTNVKRIIEKNPQIESLELNFDFDLKLLATICSTCLQLRCLSITCDVAKFYTFKKSVDTSFDHVDTFRLAFFDRQHFEYEPKSLVDLPFAFHQLDELYLDLLCGGFGNDFTELILRNSTLTKLEIRNLLFDVNAAVPLVEYVKRLPALQEFILDAHSLTANSILLLLQSAKSLHTMELLDLSELQSQIIEINITDGWQVVSSTPLKSFYKGSSMQCCNVTLQRN